MKEATLTLNWSLLVICPYCASELDLSEEDYDYDGNLSFPIFNNKWDDLNGKLIECGMCNEQIKIKSVEY